MSRKKWTFLDFPEGSNKGTSGNKFNELFHPKNSFHLAACNVPKGNQVGQQAVLSRIPETFGIDVCRVPEMRPLGTTFVITFHNQGTTPFSRFNLRELDAPVSSVYGHGGVGRVYC